jgi:hypothetical protein
MEASDGLNQRTARRLSACNALMVPAFGQYRCTAGAHPRSRSRRQRPAAKQAEHVMLMSRISTE